MSITADRGILFTLVIVIFAFLLWGRFRYDLVAFAALVVACLAGVVPAEKALSGFGHPAVVIIALVLIVSRGLYRSGAIEMLSRVLIGASRGLLAHVGIMAGLAATLSSVMNNVAALALLMPMDMQAARKAKRSPALTLMPLSFATILGGMVTLIGTPPNIVIATFREGALGRPFRMFDFTPVGIVVALTGVLYVMFVGWRLIPVARRKTSTLTELENLRGYVAELRVPESAGIVDKVLRDLDSLGEDNEIQILGLVRNDARLPGGARNETVHKNDRIVVEGGAEDIERFAGAAGLKYTVSDKPCKTTSGTTTMMEVAVPEGARIAKRSVADIGLFYRHGVILIGISRKGRQIRERPRKVRVEPGDLLLLLGPEERLSDAVEWLGCLPLADRGLEVLDRGKAWIAAGVFASAIVAASLGYVYLPLALAAVVVLYLALGIVPLSQVYESVEWPVIVLLGSMIPIGAALETSGGTDLIARAVVDWTAGFPVVAVLAILMIVTMCLSDVLNNVATALIAAPIAIEVAGRLNANPDTFLMAVAVAASCAFLTPIGHKNNTIIMGPGGYRFGDYWRMGLPLEVLVLLVGLPMIMWVWPL